MPKGKKIFFNLFRKIQKSTKVSKLYLPVNIIFKYIIQIKVILYTKCGNKQKKTVPISTVSNKQNKNYYNGTCKFPYYNNKTKTLQYDCYDDIIKDTKDTKDNLDIKVCPIEFNKNVLNINKIPIAATSFKKSIT